MKKFLLLLIFKCLYFNSSSQKRLDFLSYNNRCYQTVADAAKGIAWPFLVNQGFIKPLDARVTLRTDGFDYNGMRFSVRQQYLNPASEYYVYPASYDTFSITPNQAAVWPTRFPNMLFHPVDSCFTALTDCVGFAVRVLSAVGCHQQNAYFQLMQAVHKNKTAGFAYKGYVATAYQFATAFPTLEAQGAVHGDWSYVCGNVMTEKIDSVLQTGKRSFLPYTGEVKGGFDKVKKGDMLAFAYAPGSKFNGHAMFIDSTPYALTEGTLRAFLSKAVADGEEVLPDLLLKNLVWAVPIIDCSGKMAHFDDSRKNVSGIGRGTILMITDNKNYVPLGYVWGASRYSSGNIDKKISVLGDKVYAISVGRFLGE